MKGHRSLMVVLVLTLVTLQIQRAFADDTSYFSGKTTPFTDTYNGWKVAVPAELTLQGKGSSTHFEGPNLIGGAVSIHVNATLMKGVPSVTMFQVNIKSKKDDRNYTNVVALPTVKFGRKAVYAFRCSEADHKPGMADPKDRGISTAGIYTFLATIASI